MGDPALLSMGDPERLSSPTPVAKLWGGRCISFRLEACYVWGIDFRQGFGKETIKELHHLLTASRVARCLVAEYANGHTGLGTMCFEKRRECVFTMEMGVVPLAVEVR